MDQAQDRRSAADRTLAIAEINYLIEHGWRPVGYYVTAEGEQTHELTWTPPDGYPTIKGKERGVCQRYAINSQKKHAAEATPASA